MEQRNVFPSRTDTPDQLAFVAFFVKRQVSELFPSQTGTPGQLAATLSSGQMVVRPRFHPERASQAS